METSKKRENSIKDEMILTIQTKFKGAGVKLEGKTLDKEFKATWKQVKKCFTKGSEEKF